MGYLVWPPSLLTGDIWGISSASVYRVKSLGTSQIKTLPSSEAEAITRSLNGFLHRAGQQLRTGKTFKLGSVGGTNQSVSSTVAVWPRKSGIWSGSFPFSFKGMTAKAPPPDESQLTDKYSGLA